MLDLMVYQRTVVECAINRATFGSFDYLTCGLIGETGELAEEIKRIIRDDGGTLTEGRRAKIVEEGGLGALLRFEKLSAAYRCPLPISMRNLSARVGAFVGSEVSIVGYSVNVVPMLVHLNDIAAAADSTLEEVTLVNQEKIGRIRDKASRSRRSF